jgi:hypothetical protein
MRILRLGGAAKEVLGMLVVVFGSDAVASRNLCLGKPKVLVVSIQEAFPRRRSNSLAARKMLIVHDMSAHRALLVLIKQVA